MTEHTELPWKVSQEKRIHSSSGVFVAQLIGSSLPGVFQIEANADFIVQACNGRKALLDACNNAIQQMVDEPVNGIGEWERGLFCGLEDRDITDRYVACRYGYDKAIEKVQEWIIAEIAAAIAGSK